MSNSVISITNQETLPSQNEVQSTAEDPITSPTTTPPRPAESAPPVSCSIYKNRLLWFINDFRVYRVHTLDLSGVEHFFGGPRQLSKRHSALPSSQRGFKRIRHFFEKHSRNIHQMARQKRLRKKLARGLITQSYNTKPPFIRHLFARSISGQIGRALLRFAHRRLYSPGFRNHKRELVTLNSFHDLVKVIESDGGGIPVIQECIKRAQDRDGQKDKKAEFFKRKGFALFSGPEFTYTLLPDGVLHFSRADTTFRSLASKHALHSACASQVIYAGTFRLEKRARKNIALEAEGHRSLELNDNTEPKEQENKKQEEETLDDGEEWRAVKEGEEGEIVLVMDNDSGTYAPRTDREELQRLKALMEWNFPGLLIQVRSFVPPGLDESDDGKDEDDKHKSIMTF